MGYHMAVRKCPVRDSYRKSKNKNGLVGANPHIHHYYYNPAIFGLAKPYSANSSTVSKVRGEPSMV
jgi:hypothetical protein